MPLTEFKLEVPAQAVDAIDILLAEREEQRFMLLEDKPLSRAWITGYFDSRTEAEAGWETLRAELAAEWLLAEAEIRELPDADWKDSYKAHFKRSAFGPLHWVPLWEKADFVAPEGAKALWLDPGMAFGTGNHETTRLVAERLVAFAATKGTTGSVIDAGCGSGILALSAALLGYQKVGGFDNDPEAIRVSVENAMLNDLGGRVDFYVGDLVTGLAGRRADLVMANIQSNVLVNFTAELLGAVLPGGQLVLSGILGGELHEVKAAFIAAAPDWRIETRVMGEWSDVMLERRKAQN
ncbi:MAG: 50S ribosomal protein L11 methyltransferase [Candidatus Didemnitutus sp.]|nr:50S ribosomal protein L11 methyltransferase [Candidatus Didemnitutus sp.]